MKSFTRLDFGRCMAAILLAALALASCADDGVSFDVSTEGPKAGTTFLTYFYRDSAGARRTGPLDTATMHVLPMVPLYDGRAGVLPMIVRGDTSFLHYGTNGDIGLYEPELFRHIPIFDWVTIPASWIVYPFGSKMIVHQTLLDTSRYFTNGDTLMTMKVTSMQEFLGPEFITTAQGQLNTMKAISLRTVTVTEGARYRREMLYLTTWYSPKLGSFVHTDSLLSVDLGDGKGYRETGHTGRGTRSYNLVK